MEKYIMALDQGTTSSRCILFNKAGAICAVAQEEFTQIYPQPGWVEHDPDEILESQLTVARRAMDNLRVFPDQIAAIGITNQRETAIVWERETGRPVYNAIVWQCRRTALMVDKLREEGWEPIIREKTGLVPDPYFSATKIAWILQNVPGAREKAERGELCFGTVDSWLIWNLTGGRHVTDRTNASRTMLYDIHRLCWDDDLLRLFGIPKSMLPEVLPSSGDFGRTKGEFFGAPLPICGAAGDQQAALFGQCCTEPGQVKNTYGTGCFMLMNTGSQAVSSQNGLLTTIAASAGSVQYALEGSVFVGGAAVQWLRDELKLIASAPESEKLASATETNGGVYVVPAFSGLGAPYWDSYARGTIVGLTRGSDRRQLVRATLESIDYQVLDLLRAMESDSGISLTELKVDGGASANNWLMQFQADIMNLNVVRPDCVETTALGAAYLAGLSVGYWKDQKEIRENWRLGRKMTPNMQGKEREKLLSGWKRAVRTARFWAENP